MSNIPKLPWTICYDGEIVGADGKLVCLFRWGSYKEFSEGNNAETAHLIAAAPDLYKALQLLYEIHQDATGEIKAERNMDIEKWYATAERKVRAALAKAEGKQ